MDTTKQYRVISKGNAALFAIPALIIGAFLVSLAAGSIESYAAGFPNVEDQKADVAIAKLMDKLKILAISQFFGLLLCCGYLVWYARRAIQSESLPPAGSWIVEGQRIRTGSKAVYAAKVMMALAVVLPIAGLVVAVYMWRLALLFPDLAGAN